MRRICIVTPDVIGPVKNGGVGTHVYHLAKNLVNDKTQVTILFTGPYQNETESHWRKFYAAMNIAFVSLSTMTLSYPVPDSLFSNSLKVHQFFQANTHFDFIHFQDFCGNGFHTIQAKRTSHFLKNTLVTLTAHSCHQWINEGMMQWNHNPIGDTRLQYMEQYCYEHCDILISPSKYMIDWALSNHYNLPANRVIPNCFLTNQSKATTLASEKEYDHTHLIFFGRLEKRKGVELFVKAILALSAEKQCVIRKISFLGINSDINGMSAGEYIKESLQPLKEKISYEIHDSFSSFESIEYIRQSKGIVVIPSLLDNYPYTVVECIENDIPFIASAVGGIPELADPSVLFEPDVKSLQNKLLFMEKIFASPIKHLYSSTIAAQVWQKFHDDWMESEKIHTEKTTDNLDDQPLVSICVPYYNYGKYLHQLLTSIENNSYQNYEVIVINDGSTDEFSIQEFNRLKEKYKSKNWQFHSRVNCGIGATRNYAANQARGEYLIFMDSDNIATKDMIAIFVAGMKKNQSLDCLTCHFKAFLGDLLPSELDSSITYVYQPIGPCLSLAPFENVFGDANFIIKKTAYHAAGGYHDEKRPSSWEDYELLMRLALNGFKLDVIPQQLFWYRATPEGNSRNTDQYINRNIVLKTFYQSCPAHIQKMMTSLVIPAFCKNDFYHNNANLPREQVMVQKIIHKFASIFPYNSARRQGLKKIIFLILSTKNKIFFRKHSKQ